jgi:hypothetical protein
MDDPAISRGEDDILEGWNLSLRIPEEKSDEKGKENSQRHQNLPSHPAKKNGKKSRRDQKWEPFFSDWPLIFCHQAFFPLSQPIIDRNFLPTALIGCSASFFLKALNTGHPT